MSTTTMAASNGRARRSLNDSIARLDEMIDGLSEAIPETIRDTLKEALGAALAAAVADGVTAAVVHALRDPAFQAALRGPARPKAATLRDRVRRFVGRARRAMVTWVSTAAARVFAAARAVAGKAVRLRGVGKALWAARTPVLVTVAAGLVVTVLAVLAPHWVASVASGIGGAVTAAAVQGWLWVRRSIRPLLDA